MIFPYVVRGFAARKAAVRHQELGATDPSMSSLVPGPYKDIEIGGISPEI